MLLHGGFKAINTHRTFVTGEHNRRREKRGCSAILTGLAGGPTLVALAIYQKILPWLGFKIN